MRTAKVSGTTLSLTGDMNATTSIEILGGAPTDLTTLLFNDEEFEFKVTKTGTITANIDFPKPKLALPKLNELAWKYIDTLPELSPTYDDSKWTPATLNKTYNTHRRLSTPTSLYASDYGYHTGTLLYRGHFVASGVESTISLTTSGGSAFGMSAFLNSTYLGSFTGYDAATVGNSTFTLPNLIAGKNYVITVVVDNMGLDEDWTVGTETMKNPRGVLDYNIPGLAKTAVTWKLTGNLGGEDYLDISRGPLNEGGLFAERMGYHLPTPPFTNSSSALWKSSKGPVLDGIPGTGIGFFATEFNLGLPSGYDIPLSFTFSNTTTNGTIQPYRVQLYINGWQFGKFVSNVGPQLRFPVPQGILEYHGRNYLGVSVWGLGAGATRVQGLELGVDGVFWGGVGDVRTVVGSGWVRREGAY